ASNDQESLKGTWVVVNKGSFRKGEKWVIGQGRIREGAGDKLHRFYRLRPHKIPQEIDVTVMAGLNGSALFILHGVYARQGDELKVYFAEPGKRRPAALPQDPTCAQVLILKRLKP